MALTGDERAGGGVGEMEMEDMIGRSVLGRGMMGWRESEGRSTCPRVRRRDMAGGSSECHHPIL